MPMMGLSIKMSRDQALTINNPSSTPDPKGNILPRVDKPECRIYVRMGKR
jgi:hypothetical protein